MKTTLLFIFLLLGSVTGLRAQDKYEFATVTYHFINAGVCVSINGTFTSEKVELPASPDKTYNSNPLLNKLNELQNQNWEVLSITYDAMGSIYFATLRKKKA